MSRVPGHLWVIRVQDVHGNQENKPRPLFLLNAYHWLIYTEAILVSARVTSDWWMLGKVRWNRWMSKDEMLVVDAGKGGRILVDVEKD